MPDIVSIMLWESCLTSHSNSAYLVRHKHKHCCGNSMGDVVSLHLRMALLHKLAGLLVISLEWMTWMIYKNNNRNKPNPAWYFCRENARLILCFHVWTGKSVYIVLSGSPLLNSMALARGLRGSRKDLRRLHLVCLWWSNHLSVCWVPSLHLWTQVSREHTQSCTYRYAVHLLRDIWDTSDVGYVIYRWHWLDMIACTK